MRNLLRRLRATMGISALWASTWAIVGPLIALAMPGETRWALPGLSETLWTALGCSIAGALGGATFAILLVSNKRHNIEDFSVPHAALLGAVAGSIVPAALIALRGHGIVWALPLLAQYSLMGVLSAIATLAIAKHATQQLDSVPRDAAAAAS